MEHISLSIPCMELAVESRGVAVTVELAKVPKELFAQIIAHGVKQKLADAASGAFGEAWKEVKGEDAAAPNKEAKVAFLKPGGLGEELVAKYTLAGMEKAREALYAGNWQVRVPGGGTSTKRNEVEQEVLGLAKADLVRKFKAIAAKLGKKGTMEHFVSCGPQVKKYFTEETDKRPTWNDGEVLSYAARMDAALPEGESESAYAARAEMIVAQRASGAEAVAELEGVEELLAGL